MLTGDSGGDEPEERRRRSSSVRRCCSSSSRSRNRSRSSSSGCNRPPCCSIEGGEVEVSELDSSEDENDWMPFRRSAPDLPHSGNWSNDGFISPFQPTSLEKLTRLLQILRLTTSDVVFDLGCGDGGVLIYCAQHSGCRGVGIELDDKLLEKARRSARHDGVEGEVVFRKADVTSPELDLTSATVIFLYLLPEALELLRSTLDSHLRQPSSKIRAIVSLRWSIPGFPPVPETTDGFYIYDLAILEERRRGDKP